MTPEKFFEGKTLMLSSLVRGRSPTFLLKTRLSFTAEAKKRSIFISFVDKDSGVELLKEKFPEANEVSVHENKEKEKW